MKLNERAQCILDLIRQHITTPSFTKEPHHFALSLEDIRQLCNQNGISLTFQELEQIIDQELSPYLWTEICCSRIYVMGIKLIDEGKDSKSP